MYADPLVCIAPADFATRCPGVVTAEELRGRPFVSQRPDTDADIQSYLKKNDLRIDTRCYVNDDESVIAMVACGQGVANFAPADPAAVSKQRRRVPGAPAGTIGQPVHRHRLLG